MVLKAAWGPQFLSEMLPRAGNRRIVRRLLILACNLGGMVGISTAMLLIYQGVAYC